MKVYNGILLCVKKYLKVLRDNAGMYMSNNVQFYLGKMWEPERKSVHGADHVSRKWRGGVMVSARGE